MSYEGLEKARAERAAKDAAKEAKKALRESKKAEKEAKKVTKEVEEVARARLEVEKATLGKKKLDQNETTQKRNSSETADMPEPKAKVARINEVQIREDEIVSES